MNCTEATVIYEEEYGNGRPGPSAPIREKRLEKRFEIPYGLLISFYNNGELFEGKIVNISKGGACLELAASPAGRKPELHEDRKMECYVITPRGMTKFRGTVRWRQVSPLLYRWGISFFELPSWGDDPLRHIIASAYRRHNTIPAVGMALY